MKSAIVYGSLFTIGAAIVAARPAETADKYYEAIRNNDTAALRGLIKAGDVNSKDKRGTTPLMYSAELGSAGAMRLLIAAGADVNAKNAFEATALMWCATDLEKVRLLVEHGADINARSKAGRTALLIAASSGNSYAIVKYLIEKGADVSAKDGMQQTALLAAITGNDNATIKLILSKGADVHAKDMGGQTALMGAAANGNVEIVRLLLAKGADVNATTPPEMGPGVKKGPIALGSLTPLMLASPYGGAEVVKALIDAGAEVNAKDVRGMTPLMLAIATDRTDPATVRLLLAKGADPFIKSKNGETALDWARKFKNPPVMAALGIAQAQDTARVAMTPASDRKPVSRGLAMERSLTALQRASNTFFNEGGCFACHAQNLGAMAVVAARQNGFKVDEKIAAELAKGVRIGWSSFEQPLLQRMDPPGGPDMLAYALFQMSVSGAEADRTTDAMTHNLAAMQTPEGNWHFAGIARPPMEDGDFARTALSLRMLQVFGPAGRKAELSDRVGRAANWLLHTEPRTNEDRSMQLLGLRWTNTASEVVDRLVKELAAQQRPDGGWAQTPELESDAYATGQALYAMHEAGVPASDPAYRRGAAFLTATQLEDGSWHVVSRAPKFQPYFQSGFPHEHDQWISAGGTAWAAIALSYAAGEKAAIAQALR